MHTDSNVVRIAALASAMWLLMSVVSPEKAVNPD